MTWHDMTCCDMIWYDDMLLYDMIYDMMWCDVIYMTW